MEPECSLPPSEVPATCIYPESAWSSPYLHIPLPEDPSYQISCPHFQLSSYQTISPGPRLMIRSKSSFYGEKLSTPRPTPELEDHPLSAVSDCLFNIFAATLHNGGRSSVRNLRTRHAVVTRTHLTRTTSLTFNKSTLMCFVWIWEQTAIISLYSINWLVFITETECVYCAVRSAFYVLPTQCIYVFCVDLRTNSDYFTV